MNKPTSPILTYLSGKEDGSVIQPILKESLPEIIFGRVASCDVALPFDPSVSRRHSRLFWRDNVWWLEDLGSSNGTFVGEFSQAAKVTVPVQMTAGRIFQVARTRFGFNLPSRRPAALSTTAQAGALVSNH